MPVRRYSDPVFLQYIWNALENSTNVQDGTAFDSILCTIQSTYDSKCNSARLRHELTNAVNDNCVMKIGENFSLVPNFDRIQKDNSDWYCYECHGAGLVVSCPTCFRVYHSECIYSAIESQWSCRLPSEDPTVGTDAQPEKDGPPKHPCPVCKRLQRASTFSEQNVSFSDLHKIFQAAFDGIRNRINWKTLQKVGYLYEPHRNEYLVFEQINTRMIGDRLRCDPQSTYGYRNRTTFLVDLDNLVHNTAVFYGTKHAISNMARQIRSHLRRAMRESTYCIDCYTKPSSLSAVARVTSACRQSHRLLWFQHNGWSFRPCKMLYESADGYEVICFGGRHEREFVPRARAFDMTFTAPDLGLRMTPSLKKALDEAEEYKANQNAYDRKLSLPSINGFKHGNDSCKHSKRKQQSSDSVSTKRNTLSKRKPGPKYTKAFGCSDSESVASYAGSAKRRSSVSSNNSLPAKRSKIQNNFVQKVCSDQSAISSLSSSSDLDSDDGDERFASTVPPSGIQPASPNKNHRGRKRQSIPAKSGLLENAARTCRDLLSTPSSLASTSSTNTSSHTNSKPIIRIKPLPVRPSDDRKPSTAALESQAKPRAVSSDNPGLTCGSTTVPSHEDSSRSHSIPNNSKRMNLLSLKSHSKSQPRATDSLPAEPGSCDKTNKRNKRVPSHRVSHLSESSSSSSDDDDDSDSSFTSSVSSDSSVSSVLSSSSVSSDSTIPSLHTHRVPVPPNSTAASFDAHKPSTNGREPVSVNKGMAKVLSAPEKITDVATQPALKSVLRFKQLSEGKCNPDEAKNGNNKNSLKVKVYPAKHDPHVTRTAVSSISPPVSTCVSKPLNKISATIRLPTSTSNGSHTPQLPGSVQPRPTPPFSSSCSSSWHSSVSPAALSTTSGLGSSLSDPKSVDASPGEVAALLGNASFPSQMTSGQSAPVTADHTLSKAAEDQIHRFYTERLALLTAERDQAREELAQRDALIAKLRSEHESELKRVKQLAWCQNCLGQAFYHCCPGTAYCSESCQLQHWNEQHNQKCRRRAEVQQQS